MRSFKAGIEDISSILKELSKEIKGKDIVVLLQGDLASGKTTLVKEYIKSLGMEDEVTSPTFSLQSIYGDNIYHYDVYNKTLEEFVSLGFLEEFEKEGVHFVEWGSDDLKSILQEYGFEVLVLKIKKKDNQREYIFES
jgi:tRNA threonylcarbamoyladenosine biosynthesis protein TsaE